MEKSYPLVLFYSASEAYSYIMPLVLFYSASEAYSYMTGLALVYFVSEAYSYIYDRKSRLDASLALIFREFWC